MPMKANENQSLESLIAAIQELLYELLDYILEIKFMN